ncbi:cysteine-rich repeat secretory protein 38-like [Bidens hawaiensis]|uniref:cysteine-rich repeat secretory protein 38-like n=1 Tax=Bidens hawaiensis TaxID=980011 RepID=UPI004049FD93
MFILARKQLLWFLSFISICLINLTTLAQPDFLHYYCENDGNYTADSMYKSNLDTALSAISTTNMGLGFYKLSIGKWNDKVNSVALCRGDINADVCESCLNDSIAMLPRLCPNQKSAIVYYDSCFLRYSNETILRSTRVKLYTYLVNLLNVTDIDGFNRALGPLMKRLREKAAAGGSQQKFASGNTTGPDFLTFYAFVQCTPDLSQQQCSDCLEDAVNRISVYFNGKIGGRILLPMCNFRYEAYRFFNQTAQDITITPVLQSSLPIRPPSPSSPGMDYICLLLGNILNE